MQGPLSLKNKMLSTPVLNLSKASTPIRTRVISSSTLFKKESTPIQQLKATSYSPAHDKENNCDSWNVQSAYHNPSTTSALKMSKSHDKFLKKQNGSSLTLPYENNQLYQNGSPHEQQSKSKNQKTSLLSETANLSPIMALNRKLSKGPFGSHSKNINSRSFTPNAEKVDTNSVEKQSKRNCVYKEMLGSKKYSMLGSKSSLMVVQIRAYLKKFDQFTIIGLLIPKQQVFLSFLHFSVYNLNLFFI